MVKLKLLLACCMQISSEPPTHCSWFEDIDHAFPYGLVGINAQIFVAPSVLVVCDIAFTTMGQNLRPLMAFTPRHGVAKKCQFNLNLFPHNFSQHGHLYLGWHLPPNKVKHFQQLVNLKNFLCPFFWSIPEQKPCRQQHCFALLLPTHLVPPL